MLGCPANECIVTLKSSNGRYVETYANSRIYANAVKVKESIKWYISFIECNTIYLRSKKYGKYLSAWNDGGTRLFRPTEPQAWEELELEYLGDEQYALKTHHGKYLSVTTKTKLVGKREIIGKYETFQISVCK